MLNFLAVELWSNMHCLSRGQSLIISVIDSDADVPDVSETVFFVS